MIQTPLSGSHVNAVPATADPVANPLAAALVREKINTPRFWLLARKYATAPAGAVRDAVEDEMLKYVAAAITPPGAAGVDLGELADSVSKLAAGLDQRGLRSNASALRALIDLIPLRLTERERALIQTLERLCTHEPRTSAQIEDDWNRARSLLDRFRPVAPAGGASGADASTTGARRANTLFYVDRSTIADLEEGRAKEVHAVLYVEPDMGREAVRAADVGADLEADRNAKEAALWRYTQQEGYFSVGRAGGGRLDVAVGVQQRGQSVNDAIRGRGATLKEAIENALAHNEPGAVPGAGQRHRP